MTIGHFHNLTGGCSKTKAIGINGNGINGIGIGICQNQTFNVPYNFCCSCSERSMSKTSVDGEVPCYIWDLIWNETLQILSVDVLIKSFHIISSD